MRTLFPMVDIKNMYHIILCNGYYCVSQTGIFDHIFFKSKNKKVLKIVPKSLVIHIFIVQSYFLSDFGRKVLIFDKDRVISVSSGQGNKMRYQWTHDLKSTSLQRRSQFCNSYIVDMSKCYINKMQQDHVEVTTSHLFKFVSKRHRQFRQKFVEMLQANDVTE